MNGEAENDFTSDPQIPGGEYINASETTRAIMVACLFFLLRLGPRHRELSVNRLRMSPVQ